MLTILFFKKLGLRRAIRIVSFWEGFLFQHFCSCWEGSGWLVRTIWTSSRCSFQEGVELLRLGGKPSMSWTKYHRQFVDGRLIPGRVLSELEQKSNLRKIILSNLRHCEQIIEGLRIFLSGLHNKIKIFLMRSASLLYQFILFHSVIEADHLDKNTLNVHLTLTVVDCDSDFCLLSRHIDFFAERSIDFHRSLLHAAVTSHSICKIVAFFWHLP
jgi:hypothetical protein